MLLLTRNQPRCVLNIDNHVCAPDKREHVVSSQDGVWSDRCNYVSLAIKLDEEHALKVSKMSVFDRLAVQGHPPLSTIILTTSSRYPSLKSARAGRRSGNRGPSTSKEPIPSRATGSPIGVSSNMLSGIAPFSVNRPDTTRFVEDPITVIISQKMVANDNGIRYLDGEWPFRSA